MAISTSHRAAGRFFAAFYRWNSGLGVHGQAQCIPPLRRQAPFSRYHTALRTFTTTCAYRQTSEAVTLDKGEAKAAGEIPSPGRKAERDDESILVVEPPTPGHEGSAVEETERSTPAPAETPPDPLHESMRTLMRDVPYPVVILTAAAPGPHAHEPLGTAVSSFNTVTLDPPTISFNVREPSQTLDAIRADKGRFRVHIVQSTPASAGLVDAFTRGNHAEAFQQRKQLAPMDTSGAHFSRAASIENPDVFAMLQCTVTQEMAVRDHVIVVAEVADVVKKAPKALALTYARGNYLGTASGMLYKHTISDTPTNSGTPYEHSKPEVSRGTCSAAR